MLQFFRHFCNRRNEAAPVLIEPTRAKGDTLSRRASPPGRCMMSSEFFSSLQLTKTMRWNAPQLQGRLDGAGLEIVGDVSC